jgi:hypothetical protein
MPAVIWFNSFHRIGLELVLDLVQLLRLDFAGGAGELGLERSIKRGLVGILLQLALLDQSGLLDVDLAIQFGLQERGHARFVHLQALSLGHGLEGEEPHGPGEHLRALNEQIGLRKLEAAELLGRLLLLAIHQRLVFAEGQAIAVHRDDGFGVWAGSGIVHAQAIPGDQEAHHDEQRHDAQNDLATLLLEKLLNLYDRQGWTPKEVKGSILDDGSRSGAGRV